MVTLLLLLACGEEPVPSAPSTPIAAFEPANVAPASVLEALAGDGRSYLRLQEAEHEFWVSLPLGDYAVGDTLLLGRGPLVATVQSADLARSFGPITVIEAAREVTPAEAEAALGVPQVAGGVRIAELYARKSELAGKPVRVVGRVVKANKGIFGKNWYHLRDGTGAPGADDLTVNTDADADVGDLVTAEAPLVIDRDLGFGYFFEVILEDAALTPGATTAAAPATPAAPAAPAASARTSGSLSAKVVPSPGTLATVMSPPSATARLRQIARPRPVPPNWRVVPPST